MPRHTNAGKDERRIEVGARWPVFGDATGRVRKSMRRSGVRGTISVVLFRLGGILLTCTIRLDVVYSRVLFFAEVFQIAYFPLHLENDHILGTPKLRVGWGAQLARDVFDPCPH